MTGRVIGIRGPRALVYADGQIFNAIVSGRIKYAKSDSSLIAVGDFVDFSLKKYDSASIEKIHNRGSIISRPAVEKEGMTQVIVSNIDRLVIVNSITNPEFKPGLVDRFLILAFKENLKPVIVVNKIDLADPAKIAYELESWRRISCEIICTSALTGEGTDMLAKQLETGTSVVAGHSGVGKSSLLNRLNPELELKTREVSAYSRKGVHTTSDTSLYQLFREGWVADTPGLKEIGLAGVTRRTLHRYYPDFEPHEADCQYDDCVHIDEPDCAIKKAVSDSEGRIAQFRYENYVRIYSSLAK